MVAAVLDPDDPAVLSADVLAVLDRAGLCGHDDGPVWVCPVAARWWLRAADLAEELTDERGLHQVTASDLRTNIRLVKRLRETTELTEQARRVESLRIEVGRTDTKAGVLAAPLAAGIGAVVGTGLLAGLPPVAAGIGWAATATAVAAVMMLGVVVTSHLASGRLGVIATIPTIDTLAGDLTTEQDTLATIAARKYRWLRRSILTTAVAAGFAVAAVVATGLGI